MCRCSTLHVHGTLTIPFFVQTDMVHRLAVRISLEEILSSCKDKERALKFQESVENLPFLEDIHESSVDAMNTGARILCPLL